MLYYLIHSFLGHYLLVFLADQAQPYMLSVHQKTQCKLLVWTICSPYLINWPGMENILGSVRQKTHTLICFLLSPI